MHSSTPIDIFDSGHRKIPFEERNDSHHIAFDLASSRANERLGQTRVYIGRTNDHEG